MDPRLITLCGATMCCTALSAQDTARRPAFPYAGYVRPQWQMTDTMPSRHPDSIRVITLKTFQKRGRNYLQDSLEMERLLRGAKKPTLGAVFNFDKEKMGNEVKGADGRTHHLPGASVNIGALASLLSFGKNNRNDAFRRRVAAVQQEHFYQRYYTPEAVARFIPLRGDSLDDFVEKTRPPAGLLANATAYDLGVYIKQQYKTYLGTIRRDTIH